MNARFFSQLAHRAIAGSDVQPRVAARFEAIAPLEQTLERASDPPPPEPALTAPRSARETGERATSAPPEKPGTEAPPVHTVTRTEILERMSTRDAPVLVETAPRVMQMPAIGMPSPDLAELRPARLPDPPPDGRTSPPPLSRSEPMTPPKPTRAVVVEPAHTATSSAPRVPLLAASATAVLVPVAPVASVGANPRATVQPTPPPSPIEIVIGRIEIRSDTSPRQAETARPATRRTTMSLDDYLRGRDGGTR